MNVVWVLPVSFTYGSMEIENSTPRAFAATKIMAASRAQLGSVHSAVWATWRAETCLSWSRTMSSLVRRGTGSQSNYRDWRSPISAAQHPSITPADSASPSSQSCVPDVRDRAVPTTAVIARRAAKSRYRATAFVPTACAIGSPNRTASRGRTNAPSFTG